MPKIASLFRHPVKGLTPEPLSEVALRKGAFFPGDRLYAVEVGPSGFDPARPAHISKMKFAVLARFPELARLRTWLGADGAALHIGDAHGFGVQTRLDTKEGRDSLARFLQAYLGADAPGPLQVLCAAGHRFTDHPQGHVSMINLASVRALGWAIGADIDPLRFRANVYVDGLPPWAEDDLPAGALMSFGQAQLRLFKPIVRCIATHANPQTGERDIDILARLRESFERDTLGCYLSVEHGGRVAVGDAVSFELGAPAC